MKIMAYDTETSGLPAFGEPSESPNQPHLVELAAVLLDHDGSIAKTISHIIRPNGWNWDETSEAFKAHGISYEQAMDEGIPEADALYDFECLRSSADMRVAHNESFDAKILRIAYKRYGDGVDSGERHWSSYSQAEKDAIADTFAIMPKFCTMKASTNVVKLPPTEKMIAKGMGRLFKNPTLDEAYQHYFKRPITGAHRALSDAKHCADLFLAIQGYDPMVILQGRNAA